MTTYTPEQLGERDVRPISNRTKARVGLVVTHGDGDQTTIAQPLIGGAWRGRAMVMGLVSRGVALSDIWIVRIPLGAVGGDEATDGLFLRPVREALFWDAEDDRACGDRSPQEYAASVLEKHDA